MKKIAGPLLLAFGIAVGSTAVYPTIATAQRSCVKTTETTIIKTAPAVVAPAAPCGTTVAVPVTSVLPLEAASEENVVYTPITNRVVSPMPVRPAFAPRLDTLKMQIANRMNSGTVSGLLTSPEADEVQRALDAVAIEEANLKLTYCGVNDLVVANLMPKYHMINSTLDRLLNNSNRANYMPSFEFRRSALREHIAYHEAAGNVTPAESEQLLAALNGASDQYAAMQATGGTLSADELEQLHIDLFNIKRKLADRIAAPLARSRPEVVVNESSLLKAIQQGIACGTLSKAEGARLLGDYNKLIVLRQAIAADNGYQSAEMAQLARQIDNMRFVVERELRDRQIAGTSTRF